MRIQLSSTEVNVKVTCKNVKQCHNSHYFFFFFALGIIFCKIMVFDGFLFQLFLIRLLASILL